MDRYVSYSDGLLYATTKPVFQHDVGIKLYVSGLSSSGAYVFQFTNEDMGGSYDVTPTASGDAYVCVIPASVMMLDTNIRCFVLDKDSDNCATVMRITIPLIPRQGCD